MVMLFTEEQFLQNKLHDDAWADIYRRFPDVEHEVRRALFLRHHPGANPDFTPPTRVRSKRFPNSNMHRRHVKLPASFDEDTKRILGTDGFALRKAFLDLFPVLDESSVDTLRGFQGQVALLAEELRSIPKYDTVFEPITDDPPVTDPQSAIQTAEIAQVPNEVRYVEGVQDGVKGVYHIFPSALPEQLADTASLLVEFIDEAILLINEKGKAYVERDTRI